MKNGLIRPVTVDISLSNFIGNCARFILYSLHRRSAVYGNDWLGMLRRWRIALLSVVYGVQLHVAHKYPVTSNVSMAYRLTKYTSQLDL